MSGIARPAISTRSPPNSWGNCPSAPNLAVDRLSVTSGEKIVPSESGAIVAAKLAADTAVTARESGVCAAKGQRTPGQTEQVR